MKYIDIPFKAVQQFFFGLDKTSYWVVKSRDEVYAVDYRLNNWNPGNQLEQCNIFLFRCTDGHWMLADRFGFELLEELISDNNL